MHTSKKDLPLYSLDQFVPAGQSHSVNQRSQDRLERPWFHTHEYAELSLVYRGCAEHCSGEDRTPAPAGSLLLVRPEHCHALRPVKNATEIWNVIFPAEVLSDIAGRYYGGRFSFWAPAKAPQLFQPNAGQRRSIIKVFTDLAALPKTRFHLDRFLLEVLHLLGLEPTEAADAQPPTWLTAAVERLREPEVFLQGLEAFYTLCYRSPNHVSRSCRSFYGCTPGRLVQQARLDRAAELLIQTDMEIINIAYQVGYSDVSHFYRQFKKVFSVSPGRYRSTPLKQ